MDWEKEFDAWEAKYKPIKNPFAKKPSEHEDEFVEDKFEIYGEELGFVQAQDPRCIWTLVDGDDGNLYIVDGYHLVNRVNYFVTEKPLEGGGFLEVPYCIFEEEDEEEV
jgi:hypothetical protein